MKILIVSGLSSGKLISKVKPITELDKVEKIYVVRYEKGEDLQKMEYCCLPSKLRKNNYIRIVSKLIVTFKLCTKNNIDLIISYSLFTHGIRAFICAKIFRKPIIISLVGSDLDVGIKKSKFKKIWTLLLKKSDFIIVRGSKSNYYLRSLGINKNNILIVKNFVDLEKFKTTDVRKKYDIIFVGRLIKVKRVDILLEVISNIKEKKIRVAIVGDGPLMNVLVEKSKELKIEDFVDFLGFKDDIPYFLNYSKILVLTSEREGLPQVIVEAMACGLPSVVPNVGDIRDLAIDNYNALVVEPLDVNAFSEAINKLLNDEILYKKISHNAINTINKNYSLQSLSKNWEKIINQINKTKW